MCENEQKSEPHL